VNSVQLPPQVRLTTMCDVPASARSAAIATAIPVLQSSVDEPPPTSTPAGRSFSTVLVVRTTSTSPVLSSVQAKLVTTAASKGQSDVLMTSPLRTTSQMTSSPLIVSPVRSSSSYGMQGVSSFRAGFVGSRSNCNTSDL